MHLLFGKNKDIDNRLSHLTQKFKYAVLLREYTFSDILLK